jgi:peptidoglycan/xylan/chitin deacetylase (PgdA/CDA1 family)
MIKHSFRTLILWALDITGINALCRLLNRKKALVLWYHGVCGDKFDLLKGYDERHVPKSVFQKQLKYLKHCGYTFTGMTDLVNAIKNKNVTGKIIVLTFDDGFKNVVDNAYPVMKEFGAKGCFYLVSELIGTNELLWTDFIETVIRSQPDGGFQFTFEGQIIHYQLVGKKLREFAMKDIKTKLRTLSDEKRLEHLEQFRNHLLKDIPEEFGMADWETIKELDPNTLEIGSHTKRHPNCANLATDNELEDEIFGSKNDIERNIGRKIEHFCYPAGSYNDRVIAMVKKFGYQSAVTIEKGYNDASSDLYRLKRIEANAQLLFFKASVSGSIDILRRIRYFNTSPSSRADMLAENLEVN